MTVNLATERATVQLAPEVPGLQALRAAVAAAGYAIPEEITAGPETQERERAERAAEDRRLRVKFLVGAVLSVPVLLGSMHELFPWTPAWLRDRWLLWALTTPVQFRPAGS